MRVIPLGPERSRIPRLRDLLPAESADAFLTSMRAGGEYIKRTFEAFHDDIAA